MHRPCHLSLDGVTLQLIPCATFCLYSEINLTQHNGDLQIRLPTAVFSQLESFNAQVDLQIKSLPQATMQHRQGKLKGSPY